MKRFFISIVTLAAISVAGVSSLQLEQPVLVENLSGDEIVFGADAYFEAQTKASSGTTETTSLTSFYVSAVTGSAGSESSAWTSTQFSQVQGSSPATYKGAKMWPASNPSYKFYASNRPLTFAAAGTTVSATNTTDVVCAYLTNGTYKTKNTLTFEHIFARFGRVDVVAESGYTISNISIRITPKTGGTYNLRTGAGKTDGTGWSSVTTGSATVVANATGANANDIYLVPGTYEVKATWTATQSGTSITYTDKVVNVPIVGGKTNVVSIVLGGEILFGVDLEEYCEYNYRDNLNYLNFYCDEAGTIGWTCSHSSVPKTIQYSKDQGATWTSITSTTRGVTISVSAGDVVWFKGSNSSYGTSDFYNCFSLSNKAHVYGNVNSLTGDNTSVGAYCFYYLFKGCGSNLYTYDAKKINLPATTLANSCYYNMFFCCRSLTIAPELPATTLASHCYDQMFYCCSSLTTAPELPATTLANSCYYGMFSGCTSLTTAPELPATTLANSCYQSMFSSCSSLKSAPELPATTLTDRCYYGMFFGCTSLTTAPELPATTLAVYCYSTMFQGCTSLTTAPELPATTLVDNCYKDMFRSCSNLNYIKAFFTSTEVYFYTNNWVSGVAATGTFVKNANATWNVSGVNGVPTGWTVKTEAVPIGRFTVSANGDQVGFAPGNLQCTVQSAFAVDSQVYIGTDWCFAENQWDYLGTTDSANSLTVGKKIDLFCWVGTSATWNTYGLCSNLVANNAYYGTSDSDALKTDWGDIPEVISACGKGWFMLDVDQFWYLFNTRATGATVNGVPDARFTGASIRTDVSAVNGIILFPDGYAGGTPSGVTWGTVNPATGSGSFYFNTTCTAAGWASLEAAGCVFLPVSGMRDGSSLNQVGIRGLYWFRTAYNAERACSLGFWSGKLWPQGNDYRYHGFAVRLVKSL